MGYGVRGLRIWGGGGGDSETFISASFAASGGYLGFM